MFSLVICECPSPISKDMRVPITYFALTCECASPIFLQCASAHHLICECASPIFLSWLGICECASPIFLQYASAHHLFTRVSITYLIKCHSTFCRIKGMLFFFMNFLGLVSASVHHLFFCNVRVPITYLRTNFNPGFLSNNYRFSFAFVFCPLLKISDSLVTHDNLL